ncbi:hypothetical protein OHA72_31005 [Dactylosporangium sp. NBC_01737]|uniref:hypothetical protein n=1 Tax=Dactylosporangium sp. NBC_01737 TaxID=2975959 RepID=UPI002E112CBC|nr:hypothetical protein OHA72_31005 [Dactylosporangium sp. NBC_01737]
MSRDETSVISLTGPDSHRLVRSPGVGVVVIGPAGTTPRPDLVVAAGDAIDWSVFDPFTVPAGYPWPRRIVYEGDDTGFFGWARRRPIETFDWRPRAAHAVDASAAQIGHLGITLRDAPLRLTVPSAPHGSLSVTGDLGLLTAAPADGDACPRLAFAPDTLPSPDAAPLRLPDLPAFAGAHSVDVTVRPLRQPFDCASLLQFPEVRSVALAGQLAGVDALARLRHLTALQLRYCPDLAGLPALHDWPDLTHLIAFNVEDATGRRLRGELRRSGRQWRHSSVSQLRGPEWFATEYGLPFSAWQGRKAKAAVTAYRAAERDIAAATAPAAVEAAVRAFVGVINAMPGIETPDREDAGEAVFQLTAATPFGDLTEAALKWFDDARDF